MCTPNIYSRQRFIHALGLMFVSTDSRARWSHRTKNSAPSRYDLKWVTAKTTPSASISVAK